MKQLSILSITVAFIISSCNNISDKPVSEKLSTKELSQAIKSDTSFSGFYETVRKEVDDMDDIKKAKYNDVTYRRLFKYFKFLNDTSYWKSLSKTWDKEWDNKFAGYLPKADSTLTALND